MTGLVFGRQARARAAGRSRGCTWSWSRCAPAPLAVAAASGTIAAAAASAAARSPPTVENVHCLPLLVVWARVRLPPGAARVLVGRSGGAANSGLRISPAGEARKKPSRPREERRQDSDAGEAGVAPRRGAQVWLASLNFVVGLRARVSTAVQHRCRGAGRAARRVAFVASGGGAPRPSCRPSAAVDAAASVPCRCPPSDEAPVVAPLAVDDEVGPRLRRARRVVLGEEALAVEVRRRRARGRGARWSSSSWTRLLVEGSWWCVLVERLLVGFVVVVCVVPTGLRGRRGSWSRRARRACCSRARASAWGARGRGRRRRRRGRGVLLATQVS